MLKMSVPYLYDAIYRYKNYQQESQNIIRMLAELGQASGSLLELACGTGRYLEYFKKYDRFGIDLCDESLLYASLRNPSAQFKTLDMMDIRKGSSPFQEEQFDVIIGLFGAIGYIQPERLASCLKNWLSLLKPNGIMILEPWHFEPEAGEYKQLYSSAELMVQRKAKVTIKKGWTNMDFTFTVDHANGKKDILKSQERLYSHSPNSLQTVLHHLDASVIQKECSDFQKNGQWYIRSQAK